MNASAQHFHYFLVSGFWHGANWTFIVWGALNAIYFLPLLLTKNNRRNLDVVAQGRLLPSIRKDFDTTYDYLKDRYIRYYGAIFRPSIRALLRSYLFQKVRTFIKGEPEVEIDGSEWRHLTDAQRNSEAEAIVEIQFPSGDSSGKLEKTLEDIIGLSKEHGFELVGVKLPVSASYSKALNNANYGADKLFAAHGIPVLNFKRKYLERDDFFADPNHLNEIGGEVFTKLLLTK